MDTTEQLITGKTKFFLILRLYFIAVLMTKVNGFKNYWNLNFKTL